ncbi:MAG: UDP-N-acetylmuramoyl-L-alanyl-D-glutamate--2,6-diaminopimelate ligase [Candidatus Babeliales bacterium]
MKHIIPEQFPVACHTDNVGPGSTFVAIKGMKSNGLSYIPLALSKGATTIVVDEQAFLSESLKDLIAHHHATMVKTSNTRKALAQLSARALGFPAKKLRILAVTGTKGKSTTVFLLEHLLRSAGYKTALLSTIYNKINHEILKTNLTTQHPDYLHVFFDACVKQNVDYVIMEVAAQALSLERVEGLNFDGALFTNFDLEHLEFYATMHDYFQAKCRLLEHMKKDAPFLLNVDNEWCRNLKGSSIYSFGFEHEADYAGKLINSTQGILLIINNEEFVCPSLFGEFNAYNILGALSLLLKLGISFAVLKQGLLHFSGVPGRLQQELLPNGVRAFIDKAHNPSSYKAVLGTLRAMTDHLIVVFGCGGERDTTKRPIMGALAAQFCDLVVITSDDPRSENPQRIIDDILMGIDACIMEKVITEVDREKAIRYAYQHAKPTYIIAILGKGSDEYQLINGIKYPFSERALLQSI